MNNIYILTRFFLLFLFTPPLLYAQNKISKAEYFIDKDLGAGKCIPITVPLNSDSVDFKSLILTTQLLKLSKGEHIIGVRVKNENGFWSLPLFKSFVHSWNKISKAEYFIDKDLGAGKCNPITVPLNSDSVDFKSLILTTQLLKLSKGEHIIGVRVKNENGIWSLPLFKSFVHSWNKISKAEYFIDKDLGAGKCIQIAVPLNSDSVDFKSLILTTQLLKLSKGEHIIGVRVKNENGIWSLPIFKRFVHSWNKISKAEYFIDKDLGAGKCIPIAVPLNSDSIDFKSLILSTQLLKLSKGEHSIGIRGKNENGLWSIPVLVRFNVGQITGTMDNESINYSLICFPNPSTERIYLRYTGNTNITVKIINVNGEVVNTINFIENTEIDISKLPRGIYFIQHNEQSVSKIVLY